MNLFLASPIRNDFQHFSRFQYLSNMTNNKDLLDQVAAGLRKAALNEDAKQYLLANEQLNGLFKKGAKRYLGGDNLAELLPALKKLNDQGFACSADFMGESIRKEDEANAATEEFLRLCEGINTNGRIVLSRWTCLILV
jgi:proline dehydrogenase